MDKEFGLLNDDEVLFVRSGRILMSNPTFKVNEFLDALAQLVSEREAEWSDEYEGWFGEGLDCEVLRFGNQGWQRGRVRIRLEFSPEQPKLLRENVRQRDNVPERENLPQRENPAQREDIYLRDDIYRRTGRNDFYEDVEEEY